MHPSGPRVFTPVALAASRVYRRPFFAWSGPPNHNGTGDGSGNGNDAGGTSVNSPGTTAADGNADTSKGPGNNTGRPALESVTEDDVDTHTTTDATGGRSRIQGGAAAAQKGRLARKRVAATLPPVKLPQHFLHNNVTLFQPEEQPRQPIAIAEDAQRDKVSRLYSSPDQKPGHEPRNIAIEDYFGESLDALLEKQSDTIPGALDETTNSDLLVKHTREILRIGDMIVDAAWHLADALYPARQAEYTYKMRPFWWWHYYRDCDRRQQGFGHESFIAARHNSLDTRFHRVFDIPLAHALADLPVSSFRAVDTSLRQENAMLASPQFDAKTCKRQLTILSLTGYSGRSVAEAVGRHAAYKNQLDLVYLDAHELSVLMGDYLGQNLAYSRGPLSMLGYRAAELNGRTVQEPDLPPRSVDEDDESPFINVRAATGQLDEELRKIKQGSYECFSKWDNLKIDKMLDHIIQSPHSVKNTSHTSRGRLIHIHDIVELSMTLEGAWIIGRLRTLVDSAWQQGVNIVILGTSSADKPSDEYHNAVRDLAVEDFVISRQLQPDRERSQTRPDDPDLGLGYRLTLADKLVENVENVNRMLQAMDPESPQVIDTARVLHQHYENLTKYGIYRGSVLPIPEVYNLALWLKDNYIDVLKEDGSTSLFERGLLGPLRDKPGSESLPTHQGGGKFEPEDKPKPNGEATAEVQNLKLNEYEKRVAAGQINRENLKTSFADVHAPVETVSALKILTSLALSRPDAFSYGVLATDKIPGCLLYGPPGTGKTMLAKAVAKDSGANMIEISGATINDKWVGESEKLIRAVFTLAKKLSPCVVFIDEADALLASRSHAHRHAHTELINQFLKEWDGIQEMNSFIMVATNRPFDLDDAVLRRLPRKILVDLPMRDDRAAILKLLLRGETLDSSVSLDEFAERTPFYSGSDLKNVCVAAAMAAVEEENTAAAQHTGEDTYQYPQKRILRRDHFDMALRQIPASINENMGSLKQIRKFDEEYGRRRKDAKKSLGFGVVEDKQPADSSQARIRPGPP